MTNWNEFEDFDDLIIDQSSREAAPLRVMKGRAQDHAAARIATASSVGRPRRSGTPAARAALQRPEGLTPARCATIVAGSPDFTASTSADQSRPSVIGRPLFTSEGERATARPSVKFSRANRP